jgi:lipopolysaccharide biosynthesis glycosyltransferase
MNKELKGEIPIVFVMDRNYIPFATVATYSLLCNSESNLKIYWILPKEDLLLASKCVEKLNKSLLNKLRVNISLVGVNTDIFNTWKENGHILQSTYYKLLIPYCIDHKKIIYIDCDTLVLGDLMDLYDTNMGEFSFGGVPDPVGASTTKMSFDSADVYINGGVLLMNLEALRNDNFFEKSKNIYEIYQEKITWCDQCLINKYAENKKYLLDYKWNRQIFAGHTDDKTWELIATEEAPKIMHFIGPIKPWKKGCNPKIIDFWFTYGKEIDLFKMAHSE